MNLRFVAAISFPLLADNRNWHTATNFFSIAAEDLFPLSSKQRQAYFRYQLIGSGYQLFAAGILFKWLRHIFRLMPLKPVFCYQKNDSPLNFLRIDSGQARKL
jgi:hypothetical protein